LDALEAIKSRQSVVLSADDLEVSRLLAGSLLMTFSASLLNMATFLAGRHRRTFPLAMSSHVSAQPEPLSDVVLVVS
jgi:hypothetical protein